MKFKIKAVVRAYTERLGLALGAIVPELDKLDGLPDFQRAWYEQDPVSNKYKLNLSKVEVEDVSGLKATVQATRAEAAQAKAEIDRRVKEALRPYEGIDPVKTREMFAQFASEEEQKLIASGPAGMKKVVEARMEKMRADLEEQAQSAGEERDGALELASSLMEDAIDNKVRAAATRAGMHAGAIEDALLRARQIFSLDENKAVVQFADDGETPVMNKKGDKPFSVDDWIEERRVDCPHWFPSEGSGGGAPGSRLKRTTQDLSGLSATERLTIARQQQQQVKKA